MTPIAAKRRALTNEVAFHNCCAAKPAHSDIGTTAFIWIHGVLYGKIEYPNRIANPQSPVKSAKRFRIRTARTRPHSPLTKITASSFIIHLTYVKKGALCWLVPV